MNTKSEYPSVKLINELCNKIEAATDRNDHNGAALLLADFLGSKYTKIVKAIQAIHYEEGSMPTPIIDYRRQVIKNMMQSVTDMYGEDAALQINSSF